MVHIYLDRDGPRSEVGLRYAQAHTRAHVGENQEEGAGPGAVEQAVVTPCHGTRGATGCGTARNFWPLAATPRPPHLNTKFR